MCCHILSIKSKHAQKKKPKHPLPTFHLLSRQEMKAAISASNNPVLTMKLWTGIEAEIKTQWFWEQNAHSLINKHQRSVSTASAENPPPCFLPTHASWDLLLFFNQTLKWQQINMVTVYVKQMSKEQLQFAVF